MKKGKRKKKQISTSTYFVVMLCIIALGVITLGIVKDTKESKEASRLATEYNENMKKKEAEKVPIITLIDDDGNSSFLTNMKPVLESKDVKASLAIIKNYVGQTGNMNLEELKELQNDGYEIISHTVDHDQSVFKPENDLSLVSDEIIEAEFRDSQNYLKDNGFLGYETVVYPWGNFGKQKARYESIAKKYYKYGLNSIGDYNTQVSDNMYLNRHQINKTEDFNTVLKPIIDKCVTNNGWLILYTHSYNSKVFNTEYLEQVINYIQENNIKVSTFGEASKIKENEKN